MPRNGGLMATALIALAPVVAAAAAGSVPEEGACEPGKGVERALGRNGYRVVASGGSGASDDRSVKVQIWENDESDWVITEAFIDRDRTCVVRAGDQLHMMY